MEATSEDGRLWTAPWRPSRYQEGLHVLQVSVEDAAGQLSLREHTFSLDGTSPGSSFIGQLVLLLDMVAFFQVQPGYVLSESLWLEGPRSRYK